MAFEQWWAETKVNFPALTNELENSHLTESFELIAHAAWVASREEIFDLYEVQKIRRSKC